VAEQRVGNPRMSRDRAAEVAGDDDRAEHGGARPQVEQRRDQQQQTERAERSGIERPAHVRRSVRRHHFGHGELHSGIGEQEQRDQSGQNASRPD
jgi:hypothetical protein